jgi:hypothetical protein
MSESRENRNSVGRNRACCTPLMSLRAVERLGEEEQGPTSGLSRRWARAPLVGVLVALVTASSEAGPPLRQVLRLDLMSDARYDFEVVRRPVLSEQGRWLYPHEVHA